MRFLDGIAMQRVDALLVAIVLLVTYIYNSSSFALTLNGSMLLGSVLLLLSILCLVVLFIANGRRTNYLIQGSFLLWLGIVAIDSVAHGMNLNSEIIRMFLLASTAVLVALTVPGKIFFKILNSTVVILAAFALLHFALVNILKIEMFNYEFVSFNSVKYRLGLFAVSSPNYMYSGLWYASLSIFWEPGIFASILLLAISCQTVGINEYNSKQIIVMSIALVTTFSTAGILLLPVALVPMIFKSNSKSNILICIAVIATTFILIFCSGDVINALVSFNPSIFGKLANLNLLTVSTRLEAPLINLRLFFESPFTGLGLVEASDAYAREVLLRASVDAQTSTSTFYMAAYGVLGAVLSLLPAIGVMRLKQIPFVRRLLLIVLLYTILNKETHIFDLLYLTIPLMMIKMEKTKIGGFLNE